MASPFAGLSSGIQSFAPSAGGAPRSGAAQRSSLTPGSQLAWPAVRRRWKAPGCQLISSPHLSLGPGPTADLGIDRLVGDGRQAGKIWFINESVLRESI